MADLPFKTLRDAISLGLTASIVALLIRVPFRKNKGVLFDKSSDLTCTPAIGGGIGCGLKGFILSFLSALGIILTVIALRISGFINTVCKSEFMKTNSPSLGTSFMMKFPSLSVIVVVVVPFMTTAVPPNGSPLEFMTFPLTSPATSCVPGNSLGNDCLGELYSGFAKA